MSKQSILIALLALVALLSAGIAVWTVFFRDPTPVLLPDELPDAEETLTPTDDAGDEKLSHPEGGGAVSINCSGEAAISLSDRQVSLNFTNPTRSVQSMVVSVVIQGTTVAQSGAIPPGHQLTTLPLLDTAILSPGTYEGSFQIQMYNEDGSSANVNTAFPVSITVTE